MTKRVLKFIVDKQIITLDPDCDFSALVPGTEGYLQASFEFSNEWSECTKVAAFFNNYGDECTPQILEGDDVCMIPSDALKGRSFRVQVIGKNNDQKLLTNKVTVRQDGGDT